MAGSSQLTQDEFLDAQCEALRDLAQRCFAEFGELVDSQINWRPGPGKWSIGQCLDHLRVSGDLYLEAMTSAIAEAPGPPATQYKPTFVGRLLVANVGPNAWLPVPVPPLFEPGPGPIPRVIVRTVVDQQARIIAAADSAREININATRVTSPVSQSVRINLGDAVRVLVQHGHRHIAQAERLKGQPSFPRR